MGKRSEFERNPRDYYPTPREAVQPLLPFLEPNTTFVEPCAGAGDLVDHLVAAGHRCVGAFDIEPQRVGIRRGDACKLRWQTKTGMWITNLPWQRDMMHPLIQHLSAQAPLWTIMDAGWLHTRQSIPFLPILRKVVSIGRVRWIADTDMTGKDDSIWVCFDGTRPPSFTQFHGRRV